MHKSMSFTSQFVLCVQDVLPNKSGSHNIDKIVESDGKYNNHNLYIENCLKRTIFQPIFLSD
jgi:hypothetical protein